MRTLRAYHANPYVLRMHYELGKYTLSLDQNGELKRLRQFDQKSNANFYYQQWENEINYELGFD